jgi:hypothetical protein
MEKVAGWLKKNWLALKTIWKNFAEFLDASCLLAVSGFSGYTALHNSSGWYKALLFASAVIGLQAFVLLVKHFNKAAA